jgi:hypothetical protein
MSMELGRHIRRVPRKALQEMPESASDVRARIPGLEDMKPEDQCYFLHCRGYNQTQIAHLLGIDWQTVNRRIKKVSERVRPNDEDRAAWLQESIDSLQQVKAAAWQRFELTEDPYLLAQITAAEERIAKIRGLIDQKSRVEVSGPNGGSIPVEFAARAALTTIAAGSTEDRDSA